jgi:cell division septal protein FtsQ
VTRRRTGRRSQRRLGTQYPSTARRIHFSFKPADGRWQAHASRLVAALLLVALGWAAYAIFNSPGFYVFAIDVDGTSVVTYDEVYQAAGLEGLSIFWVDPDQVARRVESLPNVKAAHVRTGLPAWVAISIEERQPEFIWQTGEARWWVDDEGTIVPPRGDMTGALTVIDTDAEPVSPGQALDPSVVGAAQALSRLLPDLAAMNYSQATGISFRTREGWPVYLGDGRNMEAKLTVLVAMRNELLARGVSPQFIDVRYLDKPFYK